MAVRRGAYIEPPDGAGWAVRRTLALARIAAVHSQLRLDHVISHQSAALLWGLPMVDAGTRVHLIQTTTSHRRGTSDIARHECALSEDDVVSLAGMRVTSLLRTVVDCASTLRPSAGLVIADGGLRAGADIDRLGELVNSMGPRRGITRARAVLGVADDGAESPGESLTRHLLLRAGFPVPTTQVRVNTTDGPVWGDLGWEAWRVLAEYDGVAKYTATGRVADAVLAERRREVVIEREGWRVLRVTAVDLRHPATVIREVLRHAPRGTADALRPRPELADPLRSPRGRH